MRNCEYYQELISRSLDDELGVEERKELAVHLASCPSCSQMRQLMADVSQIMEEDMEELPDGLHENIMAGIRRSEMIKKNKPVEKPGKHFAPSRFRITKPVRNLLATAACMALVIVAALSLNPASRAESVVAERETPAVTAREPVQDAAAAVSTGEPVYSAEPSGTDAPAATPVPTAKPKDSGSNTIITTPVPKPDDYLGQPKATLPQNTAVPVQPQAPVQTPTPVNQATPDPVPVQTQPPVQTQAPASVTTEEPVTSSVDSSAQGAGNQVAPPSEEIPAENPADIQEPEVTAAPQIIGEVHKAPPARVFGLFPSLASIDLEQHSEEAANGLAGVPDSDPQTETGEEGTQASAPMVSPDPDKKPTEIDLMECENAEDIMLLLMGMLDEHDLPPEEAELPHAEWDESYIINLVVEKIPCELTVQIFDGKVYFSLAEIIIEPDSQNNGAGQNNGAIISGSDLAGNSGSAEAPAVKPSPATGGEQLPAEEEDFEPVWFLAQCSSDRFTELLNKTMK